MRNLARLVGASALLLVCACAGIEGRSEEERRMVLEDSLHFAGAWQAGGVLVAGEVCAPAVHLDLLVEEEFIGGRALIGAGSKFDEYRIEGGLDATGRWDLVLLEEPQAPFATASGWFREERAVGLLEVAGDAPCIWRLHLDRV